MELTKKEMQEQIDIDITYAVKRLCEDEITRIKNQLN